VKAIVLVVAAAACSRASAPPTEAELGKLVFEDPGLSNPTGQACADCHAAHTAFRDFEDNSQSMGVVAGRFGARNAPSLLYAQLVPAPYDDADLGRIGGLFWDGRAVSLEDQVAGPLFNPVEMNVHDRGALVAHVRSAGYARAFAEGVLDDVDRGYDAIARVIAAYERGTEFAPFSSRYDRYLAGTATLTAAEQRGLAIFEDPARGDCARCHPSQPGPAGEPPMFTTFGYANIGVPRYPNNRFYTQPTNPDGERFVDRGLGAITGRAADDGKFRIPTLRDVARTAPYGHNGYFSNLPYMLEFIANRDAGSYDVPTCSRAPGARVRCPWPAPEIAANVDPHIGHHTLEPDELADLAAFLETLTDE
jgi:cytochrome c peroxidase